MADRIAEPWGERTPYRGDTDWPVRTDMFLLPGFAEPEVERWVAPYHLSPEVAAVRVTKLE